MEIRVTNYLNTPLLVQALRKNHINFRSITLLEEHTIKKMVKINIKPTYFVISQKVLVGIV